jgi:enoyl-CoA hydratase/carnithine racemase
MGPADAIYATFADSFVPEADWVALKETLAATGDVASISTISQTPPEGTLPANRSEIDGAFERETVADIAGHLADAGTPFAAKALERLQKGSPLAMACGLRTIRAARDIGLLDTFKLEYRFTHRAQQSSDFLEGIRAQVIDRDFAPRWRHNDFDVPTEEIDAMLAPLGVADWSFEGEDT